MKDLISVLAFVVAIASFLLSWAAFRVQRRRTNLELARSLHADLTSGEVAKARESLGTIPRDRRYINSLDPEQRRAWYVSARTDYFTLLWCFERIWAGRLTITDDERRRGKGPACQYLDNMIRWHVLSWALDLPVIKEALELELRSQIEDGESVEGFVKLSAVLLGPADQSEVEDVLARQGLKPVGYDERRT